MKSIRVAIIVSLLLISIPTYSAAGLMDWLKQTTGQLRSTKLSETKVADGLREALRVGINNAVAMTGKVDGFFGNDAIKILLPEKVQLLGNGLRMIGMGNKVDEFVLSMNRAAEHAAPHAREIFIDAIMDMSFDDAMAIYNGSETAATDYFRDKTHDRLVDVFLPHARKSLDQFDVTKQYRALTSQFQKLPMSSRLPSLDVEQYVVGKTVDGLFYVLAEEETRIRTQPSARVTKLLQEVFNKSNSTASDE